MIHVEMDEVIDSIKPLIEGEEVDLLELLEQFKDAKSMDLIDQMKGLHTELEVQQDVLEALNHEIESEMAGTPLATTEKLPLEMAITDLHLKIAEARKTISQDKLEIKLGEEATKKYQKEKDALLKAQAVMKMDKTTNSRKTSLELLQYDGQITVARHDSTAGEITLNVTSLISRNVIPVELVYTREDDNYVIQDIQTKHRKLNRLLRTKESVKTCKKEGGLAVVTKVLRTLMDKAEL